MTSDRPHAHLADEFALLALEPDADRTDAHRDRLLRAAEVHASLALAEQLDRLHAALLQRDLGRAADLIVLDERRRRRRRRRAVDDLLGGESPRAADG